MKWVVTDTKYLTKPSKDWQPHIPTANTDTAYIEVRLAAALQLLFFFFSSFSLCLTCFSMSLLPQYKASKEGTVMGVAVSKISMLTHCQALTQACNYCEGPSPALKILLISHGFPSLCCLFMSFFLSCLFQERHSSTCWTARRTWAYGTASSL